MATTANGGRQVGGIARTESAKSDNADTGRTPLQRSMDVFWAITNLTVEWNKTLVMGSFVSQANQKQYWKDSHKKMAQLIVDNIKNLKGCWVKVGQILSTKPGMLPMCYVDAFSQLQDRVGHSDFAEVLDVIEEEIGYMDEVFANFDSIPLASASIAQVHKATLRDGTMVAIKVQHKCSEQNMRNDLEIFKVILWVAQSVGHCQNMFASIDDYTAAAMNELDFAKEAENCRRASVDAKLSGIPIFIPRIFNEYCSRRVVTMELFELYKMTDLAFFEKHNINAAQIVYDIHDFAMFQILSAGQFHGDPHPGNLLMTQGKSDGKFYPVLIDWGMTQSLSTKQRVGLCKLTFALCMGDTIGCFTGFVEAGFDMSTHKTFCYEQFLESLYNIFASDFSKVLDVCADEGATSSTSEDKMPVEWHYNGKMFIKEFITNAPNFFTILLKVVSEYRNYALMLKTSVPLLQILYKNAGNAQYNLYYTPLSKLLSSESSKAVLMRKVRRVKKLLSADCIDLTEKQILMQVFNQALDSENSNVVFSGTTVFRKPRGALEAKLSSLLTHLSQDNSLIVATQVFVLHAGEVEVDLCHGFMGQYECRPISPNSLFQVGNLMNGLIATAVLHLTEHHDVALDDPISKHWPSFGQNGKEGITIRDMLNHSSGLILPYPNILLIENLDYDTMIKDIEKSYLHKEMPKETSYGYLYFGWIMAEVVRRVSGKSLEEYIFNMAASTDIPLTQFVFPSMSVDIADYASKKSNSDDTKNNEEEMKTTVLDPTPSSVLCIDEPLIDIPLGDNKTLNSLDESRDNSPVISSTNLITLDLTSVDPEVKQDGQTKGFDSTIVKVTEEYSAALKSKFKSFVDFSSMSTTSVSSSGDKGYNLMDTIVINGREIAPKRVTMVSFDSSNSQDDMTKTGSETTEMSRNSSVTHLQSSLSSQEPVVTPQPETKVDVKDILMSMEEFLMLPSTPELMPSPSENVARAKCLPPEKRRGYAERLLQRLEPKGGSNVDSSSASVVCMCGVNSSTDEEFYHRCFSPSEKCPVTTRFVRHYRLPLVDLEKLDLVEAEKLLSANEGRGTNGRYHPILVSEEDVLTEDADLHDFDLINEDTVLSRLRRRRFITKLPSKLPAYHYCNYDAINYRCIITDPLAMDYPSTYSKSVPCLNARASAQALSYFYKSILDGVLVGSDLLSEVMSTESLDRGIVTKMLTAFYTPVWCLGYQRFYLRYRDGRDVIGLGCVDVSGSLNLMVPELNLVVTALFSSGSSVCVSHKLVSVVLDHYGLTILHTNINVGDPTMLYRLLATIKV
ncbi:putative aarF domain-containing protein kinase 1 -like protein [Babesia sp. Xinjiang]|uniref:putative aarF domain-containing protein kinase 1 -like protein n=1 Tax=Babesia sp. Xinjiang TaxID=462227 RepID=UPI000A2653C6|nr:putative aarF domain-containing protein kinase 1 -like protein [Babesia sp. Xinjiang]ORM41937.1 putative aarF domain-containing protein kinase 1 -like protein [Babesia sp. Xinjiang]